MISRRSLGGLNCHDGLCRPTALYECLAPTRQNAFTMTLMCTRSPATARSGMSGAVDREGSRGYWKARVFCSILKQYTQKTITASTSLIIAVTAVHAASYPLSLGSPDREPVFGTHWHSFLRLPDRAAKPSTDEKHEFTYNHESLPSSRVRLLDKIE